MFWIGWACVYFLVRFLMPIWKSIWAYLPYVGGDVSYLGYVFLAIAISAIALHFLIPKSHTDWRFNMYILMIFSIETAVELLFPVWFTTVWF
jgi:hypothetical protein